MFEGFFAVYAQRYINNQISSKDNKFSNETRPI